MDWSDLLEEARSVKEHAYQPYSGYSVGAAVLTSEGNVYVGCNIETVTLDMTSHSERTAFHTAIANGETDFDVLAISVDDQDGAPPCGTCRQFIAEFCDGDFQIISDTAQTASPEQFTEYTLAEILPHSFQSDAVLD